MKRCGRGYRVICGFTSPSPQEPGGKDGGLYTFLGMSQMVFCPHRGHSATHSFSQLHFCPFLDHPHSRKAN